MDAAERSLPCPVPAGFWLAPLHPATAAAPLKLGVLVRAQVEPGASPFLLLRQLPSARVYLGAVCDTAARVLEWVEIWVQELELREVAFSSHKEALDNPSFDQRWMVDFELACAQVPDAVLVTGFEGTHPRPVLIQRAGPKGQSPLANVREAPWQLCQDDPLLQAAGLAPYSRSAHRYLHEPGASGAKVFLATSPEAPSTPQVQELDRLELVKESHAVFNRHAGLLRVHRFSPLELDDYFQILEGRPWEEPQPRVAGLVPSRVYTALKEWAGSGKGLPFLWHGRRQPAEQLNEVFYLKLAVLRELLRAVRAYVRAHQLPLLNLSPASFRVRLPEVGEAFPGLWAARVDLVRPGQAYLLKIQLAEQKYFVRLGAAEPSPFLPEGLGAHSFGIGSVRLRQVNTQSEGVVLEGTLVAEDYLGLDPHDLLWFKLPLGEERLEFYAHVSAAETVGPKEARFRTVPARHSEAVVASLKRAMGASFQRAPYEVWPLLSSPCDLFSLGVIGVRLLLANSQTNLAVVLDEVLSLGRHFGKETDPPEGLLEQMRDLLQRDAKLLDLVSPHALVESDRSPAQARQQIQWDLWVEAVALLLRLFPGLGPHSYCRSFGDVSSLALETVFDAPLQEVDRLLLRLRSVLLPSPSANQEIAELLVEGLE